MPNRPRRLSGILIILAFLFSVSLFAADKVNLNTATTEELDALPAIGKYTAEKIISMRPITDLDALLAIKGMKQDEVEVLRGLVTLGEIPPNKQPAAPVPSDALKADIQLAEKYLKDSKSPQPENWEQVIAQWKRDAESPSPRKAASARWKLGQCYLDGTGVDKDEAEGMRYYEGAAEVNPESWRLFNVAKLYRAGGSIPADPEKEISWTKRAAEAGSNVWAEYRLAQLYANRDDREPDYAAALEWAHKAQQNNPPPEIVKTLGEYVETFSKLVEFPKPAVFQISVAGSPVQVSRIGTGPVGILVFPHSGARAMNRYILANQDCLKELVPEKCSLFLWEYPKAAPFDKVQPTLSAYMQGDKSTKLPLAGIASSVVAQVKEKSGLKNFLLVGNSLGAGLVLQDYKTLLGDKALGFLLISPTEPVMPETETLPPLERTTIIVAKDEDAQQWADPWLRGENARAWVKKNRAIEWDGLMTKSGLDSGHFIIGEKITAELLAQFVRVKLGLADKAILAEKLKQTDENAPSPAHAQTTDKPLPAMPDLKQAAGVPVRPTLPRTFPLSRPTQEGKVVAWGFAEGSNGGNPEASQLIQPPEGLMAVQVSANQDSSPTKIHCLALKSDGTVAAWGWNGEGQCAVPPGLKDVVSVVAGDGVSLALRSDGTVTAWGSGQRYSSLPKNLSNVVQAAFTQSGTLFLLADGMCRYVPESSRATGGRMEKTRINGQLYEHPAGLGGTANVEATIIAASTDNLVAIAGGRHGYALSSSGQIIPFRLREDPDTTVPKDLGPVGSLPVTPDYCDYVAAIQIDGTIRAWGRNDNGQCDPPPNLPPVKSLSTGSHHAAAITTGGTLFTWGWNWHGERDIPSALTSAKFLQVFAGDGFNVAIIEPGKDLTQNQR